MKRTMLPLLIALIAAIPAWGMDGCGAGSCASCHTMTVDEANRILKSLGGGVKGVKPSQVKGLWELSIEKDGQKGVAHMDFGKKHILSGQIFDIATRKPIAEAAQQPPKIEKIKAESVPSKNSIVMGNPKAKKKLFVFTDPDCPYCSKLHAELKKLVKEDKELAVYVKLFPLKNIHPKAYDKSRAILSGKASELLDRAFAGGELPMPAAGAGVKAVDETISFAQANGITATPTLVLPDGRIMPGFRDAAAIRKLLAGE